MSLFSLYLYPRRTWGLYIFICAFVTVGVALALVFLVSGKPVVSTDYSYRIELNGKPLDLEIADTSEERSQGLSYRKSMRRDQGMLFIMNTTDRHTFWMKGTHFPLDIIWLRNGIVVDIATLDNPGLGEFPAVYTPKEEADQVLELNKGMVKEYGIEIGSKLQELNMF